MTPIALDAIKKIGLAKNPWNLLKELHDLGVRTLAPTEQRAIGERLTNWLLGQDYDDAEFRGEYHECHGELDNLCSELCRASPDPLNAALNGAFFDPNPPVPQRGA